MFDGEKHSSVSQVGVARASCGSVGLVIGVAKISNRFHLKRNDSITEGGKIETISISQYVLSGILLKKIEFGQ